MSFILYNSRSDVCSRVMKITVSPESSHCLVPFIMPIFLVTSSNLAFFSESRIRLLAHRLGHDKVRELIERVSSTLGVQHHSCVDLLESRRRTVLRDPCTAAPQPFPVSPEVASTYIKAYFDRIHPLFPFIDRDVFEERSSSPDLAQQLTSNLSFSALYHAVLALGCQHSIVQTFGQTGQSWQLYEIALALLPSVLLQRETLVNLQVIKPYILLLVLTKTNLMEAVVAMV